LLSPFGQRLIIDLRSLLGFWRLSHSLPSLVLRDLIQVTEKELRIGRAHIELKYLSKVEQVEPAQMRLLRTRDADPASYLAITFWISTGVKITLQDERDPTPYWLVSCKKSKELTSTLYKLL
jgi:hypothetical protein